MSSKPAAPQPASPLDAFLARFLRHLADLGTGYSPASHARAAADATELPPPFLEALFTSARARGLIEPFRSPHARGRTRWRLSPRGRAFLAIKAATAPPGQEANPG